MSSHTQTVGHGSRGRARITVGGYAFSLMTATMGSHDQAAAVQSAFRACLGAPALDV